MFYLCDFNIPGSIFLHDTLIDILIHCEEEYVSTIMPRKYLYQYLWYCGSRLNNACIQVWAHYHRQLSNLGSFTAPKACWGKLSTRPQTRHWKSEGLTRLATGLLRLHRHVTNYEINAYAFIYLLFMISNQRKISTLKENYLNHFASDELHFLRSGILYIQKFWPFYEQN